MRMTKICDFYNTEKGCRRGDSCDFLHVGAGGGDHGGDPGAQGKQGNKGNRQDKLKDSCGIPAPRGVCHNYWNEGHCRFALDCTFAHQVNPNLQATKGASSAIENNKTSLDVNNPNFVPDIKAMQGRATDRILVPTKFVPMNKVQRILKEAVQGQRTISSAAIAEEFLLAILASNEENAEWEWEDRQNLVTKLTSVSEVTKSPQLLRLLSQIVRWPVVNDWSTNKGAMPFQSCYMGIIAFLTSGGVIKSASYSHTSALYALVDDNLEHLLEILEESVDSAMSNNSFKSATKVSYFRAKVLNITTGIQIFKPIAVLLLEFHEKFRNASTNHPELATFVHSFSTHFETWVDQLIRGNFDDALANRGEVERDFLISKTREDIKLLLRMTDQRFSVEEEIIDHGPTPFTPGLGVLAQLDRDYNGPGELAENGPRHDNDHVNFREIQIPPTPKELLCKEDAYLPANIVGARHHLPHDSIEKNLDIQFRLLRADATRSLQIGVSMVIEALESVDYHNTNVAKLVRNGGGMLRGSPTGGSDSIMMPMMTDITFKGLTLSHKEGLVIMVRGRAPPGPARSTNAAARQRFLEQGKRLPQGGLVAIVTKERGVAATVTLAVLTEHPSKIQYTGNGHLEFGLAFVDSQDGLNAGESLRYKEGEEAPIRLLLESPVLWESVRPFLESIQRIDPMRLPLATYIKHGDLQNQAISLPEYSTVPNFTWDLKVLLKQDEEDLQCFLDPTSDVSIAGSRAILHEHGKLDPSQSDAVLDALTREIALIQGPPGTGKTFTGVELIRLLFANNVGPILLLAFTNHALDHILRAIHDADITKDLLRLGSRSKDEVISQYSLDALEQVQRKTSLHLENGKHFAKLKTLEESMKKVSARITSRSISDDDVNEYLEVNYPELLAQLESPPDWTKLLLESATDTQGWTTIGRNPSDGGTWSFWSSGADIDHIESLRVKPSKPPAPLLTTLPNQFQALSLDNDNGGDDSESESDLTATDDEGERDDWSFLFHQPQTKDWGDWEDSDDESKKSDTTTVDPIQLQEPQPLAIRGPTSQEAMDDRIAFLEYFDLKVLPRVAPTNRDLEDLLEDCDVWNFSMRERKKVAEFIISRARREIDEDSLATFENLTDKHATVREQLAETRNNIRVSLLKKIKLLGSTTTGAAKLVSVLKGFAPKVLIIEEAGQVLEAHAIATLFPSIQHVIAIGDPLQLRPNINNYELSTESRIGSQIYRFDVSLMERLSSAGLPMSQLQVQRRMRPQISSLIRNTLYPRLQDHDVVQSYPDVRGMGQNVYFLDHMHRESSGDDDGASKSNDYEVAMSCDLALYLLKQGCYTEEGSIVILCAYLGQLMKMRDALKGKAIVMIDERDQREIDKRVEDGDEVPVAKEFVASKCILLRTVDNFQGEEAKIVILSLVRNAGHVDDQDYSVPKTIGFLKSENRTNVALSRAKHGLYILGNAPQLAAKSEMWKQIIDDLSVQGDCIGEGWPIACSRHPEDTRYATEPGQISILAPQGGCLKQCDMPMPCGHVCRQKCHPDDLEHTLVKCERKCTRLLPDCGHACTQTCAQECGPCEVPKDVELLCGHTATVTCSQSRALEFVRCTQKVTKSLPTCEHEVEVECWDDMSGHLCRSTCDKTRQCCGRSCTASCWECQALNGNSMENTDQDETTKIDRIVHKSHPCGKVLDICGHQCGGICEPNHVHQECREQCLQRCEHKQCRYKCCQSCQPCKERCGWSCSHGLKCSLPCAMPCDRLPCDEPCDKLLSCGHPCLSVCSEPCKDQICPECAPEDKQSDIVDLIMNATLREVIADEPETRFITLICGHTFTVETLDGHVGMSDFYEINQDGNFSGSKTPSSGFKARPTCPTCRGPITALRYSRPCKRALLDIQEQHGIHNMGRDLRNIRNAVQRIDIPHMLDSIPPALKNAAASKNFKMPVERKLASMLQLNREDTQCIRPSMFSEALKDLFLIDGPMAVAWKRISEPIMKVYERLSRMVNNAQLPHVLAHEAAISTAFHEEMHLAQQRPNGRNPAPIAMLMARRRVGAPFPRGGATFKIEALIESIFLRLELASLAGAFVSELERRVSGVSDKQTDLRRAMGNRFQILMIAIIRSCRRDADLAANLCHQAETKRLGLKVELVVLQSSFDYERSIAKASIKHNPIGLEETMMKFSAGRNAATNRVLLKLAEVTTAQFAKDPLSIWVVDTLRPQVDGVLEEWEEAERIMRTGNFYQSVSLKEQKEVARAVMEAEFRSAGRFYQCPNGHLYTVGECGQTMVEATCMECGSAIGGRHHNLRSDNTRDMEMERFAMEAGAMRNPHANI